MNTLQFPRKRTLRSRFQLFLAPLVVLLSTGCLGEEDLERPRPLYGEEPVEYPLTLWDTDVEGEDAWRMAEEADVAQAEGETEGQTEERQRERRRREEERPKWS